MLLPLQLLWDMIGNSYSCPQCYSQNVSVFISSIFISISLTLISPSERPSHRRELIARSHHKNDDRWQSSTRNIFYQRRTIVHQKNTVNSIVHRRLSNSQLSLNLKWNTHPPNITAHTGFSNQGKCWNGKCTLINPADLRLSLDNNELYPDLLYFRALFMSK